MTSGFDSSGEFHEHCTHVVSTLDLLPGDLLDYQGGWCERVTDVEPPAGCAVVAKVYVLRTAPDGRTRPAWFGSGIGATHEVIR